MKNLLVRQLLAVFLFSFSISAMAEVSESQTYSFAVVPQQSAQRLAELWQPLFDEVFRLSGVELLFTTAPSIPDFEKRLAEGEYDFAYMNPYHYTVFADQPGYRAFAKSADKQIKGIVVVQKDSEYQTLEDLAGIEMAFPAPKAFAATVLPRSHLANSGTAVQPFYVRTHDSVYLNVAQNNFAAGGGIYRTFNNMPEEVKSQLRVLWESPGYTPHALAHHPRLSNELVAIVQQAFANLANSEQGKSLLANLGISQFEAAEDANWDDVRALGIEGN